MEVNSTWPITSELANQGVAKALLTCVVFYINNNNSVNNKMHEYDWLLTTLICGLIDCFRSKVSDLTCSITNICNRTYLPNWTVKQPIKIKQRERCRLKTNMDEMNWSNEFYPDMFS